MAPASKRSQDRTTLFARNAHRAGATLHAQCRRRTNLHCPAWDRPSSSVRLLHRRTADRYAHRKIASNTSTSLPTAASYLSRATLCQNNEPNLLLSPAAVRRCQSVCNHQETAEQPAIHLHLTSDAFHFPK